jgi:hypothetical protein
MVDQQDVERRIRERAHQIWMDSGQPEGQAEAHWELARLAIAQEDAQASMLVPAQAPPAEQAEVVENLGEFPTMTDQGEGPAFPAREHIPEDGNR